VCRRCPGINLRDTTAAVEKAVVLPAAVIPPGDLARRVDRIDKGVNAAWGIKSRVVATVVQKPVPVVTTTILIVSRDLA